MVEIREIINKRIEERLAVVEQKLRNSFRDMRKDNDENKRILKEVIENLKGFSKERVVLSVFNKEINTLREEIKTFKKSLEKSLENKSSLDSNRISSIEKKLSDKDINERVKKLVIKDMEVKFSDLLKKQKEELKVVYKENNKKISKEFDKYTDKAEYLKKEFLMFRNEFIVLRESLDKWKVEIGKELNSLIEEKEETFEAHIKDLKNQINSLKSRNTILTKELNNFKGNGSKKLIEDIKKKETNKKTFISKIVDSLAD